MVVFFFFIYIYLFRIGPLFLFYDLFVKDFLSYCPGLNPAYVTSSRLYWLLSHLHELSSHLRELPSHLNGLLFRVYSGSLGSGPLSWGIKKKSAFKPLSGLRINGQRNVGHPGAQGGGMRCLFDWGRRYPSWLISIVACLGFEARQVHFLIPSCVISPEVNFFHEKVPPPHPRAPSPGATPLS